MMGNVPLFSVVAVLASLLVILAINRGFFRSLGAGRTLRLLLIWGVIIVGLVLLASIVGVPEQFRRDGPSPVREAF